MTVSAQTPLNRSVGNGVTTVFPYNFKVLAEADMEVSVDGVVKTLTTDYTLSGVGTDSGNVTFLVAPAVDTVVVRRRNMAYTRSVDYQDQGELPTDTLDDDQDAPVLMCQQLAEGLSRAVQVPIDETTDPAALIDSLLTASAAAVAAAASADADATTATNAAAAAAASAASTGLPSLIGKALNWLRVKADETGYETRTPAETRGDIGAADAAAVVNLTGNQTIAGIKTFSSMPVLPAHSMVRLNTANGYGSTNTMIRRFGTVVTNQGSDIVYADSATLGATFTIQTTGMYAISYSDQFSAADYVGLSLNSNQLTTAFGTPITAAHVLAADLAGTANRPGCAAVTVYLQAGDVVRAHTNGTASGTLTALSQFVISRVS